MFLTIALSLPSSIKYMHIISPTTFINNTFSVLSFSKSVTSMKSNRSFDFSFLHETFCNINNQAPFQRVKFLIMSHAGKNF